MASNNPVKRQFSYTHPVQYGGTTYPSARIIMDGGSGSPAESTIFMAGDGQYYTLDSQGQAYPVMLYGELPEVQAKPSRSKKSSDAFGNYLTMSSDHTQVLNTPHRDYNSHLVDGALRGARYHAQWDRQHPNLSQWRDLATAIPLAVAATPLAVGAADALAATALGQSVTNGLGLMTSAPAAQTLLPWADAAITSGFSTRGLQDIRNGKFTPETAMDLMPLTKSLTSLTNGIKRVNKISDTSSISNNIYNKIKHNFPLKGETEIPKDIKAEIAKKYTEFINSEDYLNKLRKAGLEDHWEYMKDLTDRRLNNVGYFPSKVKAEINNDPKITGLSSVEPSSKNYGITLQEDLPIEEVFSTGYHEVAHWATGNAGISNMVNSVKFPFLHDSDVRKIGDIMRYNESIAPVKEWDDILQTLPKEMPIDKVMKIQDDYNYLIRPQEIRARLYNIHQQAQDAGIPLSSFINKFVKNGKITSDAPINLQQLGEIFTIDNLRKRFKNFLGISTPIGVSISLSTNNENEE